MERPQKIMEYIDELAMSKWLWWLEVMTSYVHGMPITRSAVRTLLLCFSFCGGNFVVYKSASELTSGQGRGDARPPEATVQRIRKRQFLCVSSLSATRQFSRRYVAAGRSGHLSVYGNADRLASWSCIRNLSTDGDGTVFCRYRLRLAFLIVDEVINKFSTSFRADASHVCPCCYCLYRSTQIR